MISSLGLTAENLTTVPNEALADGARAMVRSYFEGMNRRHDQAFVDLDIRGIRDQLRQLATDHKGGWLRVSALPGQEPSPIVVSKGSKRDWPSEVTGSILDWSFDHGREIELKEPHLFGGTITVYPTSLFETEPPRPRITAEFL